MDEPWRRTTFRRGDSGHRLTCRLALCNSVLVSWTHCLPPRRQSPRAPTVSERQSAFPVGRRRLSSLAGVVVSLACRAPIVLLRRLLSRSPHLRASEVRANLPMFHLRAATTPPARDSPGHPTQGSFLLTQLPNLAEAGHQEDETRQDNHPMDKCLGAGFDR